VGSRELIVDPGTCTYNGDTVWRDGLASAIVHNGPVLDDQEPAVRGPRFLWLTWPRATLVRSEYGGSVVTMVAELDGRVRRTVDVTRAGVTVRDRVLDSAVTVAQVTWLLAVPPRPGEVTVDGGRVLEASPASVTGWFFPTYGQAEASQALQVRLERPTASTDIVTVIRPFFQQSA